MGRNARRRAAERDLAHPAGADGQPEGEPPSPDERCPACGSTRVIALNLPLGASGRSRRQVDLTCADCGHVATLDW